MTDTDVEGAAVSMGGVVRAPSWERRAAALLHQVAHSVGLILTTVDAADGEYSFRVTFEGEVIELAGWGRAGPVPPLDEINGPPNLLAVHTVLVDTGDDEVTVETFVGLRELVEEHVARYAECRVWVTGGAPRDLVEWARAGCPEPHLLAVPSAEEVTP